MDGEAFRVSALFSTEKETDFSICYGAGGGGEKFHWKEFQYERNIAIYRDNEMCLDHQLILKYNIVKYGWKTHLFLLIHIDLKSIGVQTSLMYT